MTHTDQDVIDALSAAGNVPGPGLDPAALSHLAASRQIRRRRAWGASSLGVLLVVGGASFAVVRANGSLDHARSSTALLGPGCWSAPGASTMHDFPGPTHVAVGSRVSLRFTYFTHADVTLNAASIVVADPGTTTKIRGPEDVSRSATVATVSPSAKSGSTVSVEFVPNRPGKYQVVFFAKFGAKDRCSNTPADGRQIIEPLGTVIAKP